VGKEPLKDQSADRKIDGRTNLPPRHPTNRTE
jgi:hypothetical protein